MKRLVMIAVSASTLAAVSFAAADGPSFGARAHTVLVLDNLAGVMNETYGTTDNPTEEGITTFGSGTGLYAFNVVTRFGVHQFIGDTVSLGAGIHYSDRAAGSLERLGRSATIIAFAPRVGFAIPLSGTSAFWFRIGGTYLHASYSGDAGNSHDVMLGSELYYVYTPVEHFGITLGPVIEVGIDGAFTSTSRSGPDRTQSTRRRMFGLAFGFLFDL